MVIVYTNGFHQVAVEFCICDGIATPAYQLADTELFPAAFDQPETPAEKVLGSGAPQVLTYDFENNAEVQGDTKFPATTGPPSGASFCQRCALLSPT